MSRPEEFKNQAIILGVQIDDLDLGAVLERVAVALSGDKQLKIFTPNPEICLLAERDEEFRRGLNDGDINIPDGFGLKLGAAIFGETLVNRVTGADLTGAILEKYKNSGLGAGNRGLGIYILTLDISLTKKADLEQLFKRNYPQLRFRNGVVTKADFLNCDKVLNDILDFAPQVLFVCLGAPRQEIWISKYLKTLTSVRIALGVGGSFDFLTGKIKRAPEFLRKLGMEWFYRLYQEPKRLGRIKNATAVFLLKCHEWEKRIATELRPNVLGIIRNKDGHYLIQKNAYFDNHWQFPQGGIDPGESTEQAIIREASEELGIEAKFLKVVKKFPEQHEYIWPRYAQLLRGYRGQTQTAFLLDFTGTDQDIILKNSHEVEAIKWVAKQDILPSLHPIRRKFAEILVKYL